MATKYVERSKITQSNFVISIIINISFITFKYEWELSTKILYNDIDVKYMAFSGKNWWTNISIDNSDNFYYVQLCTI